MNASNNAAPHLLTSARLNLSPSSALAPAIAASLPSESIRDLRATLRATQEAAQRRKNARGRKGGSRGASVTEGLFVTNPTTDIGMIQEGLTSSNEVRLHPSIFPQLDLKCNLETVTLSLRTVTLIVTLTLTLTVTLNLTLTAALVVTLAVTLPQLGVEVS